jgi:D-glycero-D-manno-heptose 1,7-bisphosphate phosphatase
MALVALDRDGVMNFDSSDYIKSASEWQPIPGSIEAIKLLCDKGYQIYVATNQAGLARGLFTPKDLEAMHAKLHKLVNEAGGRIAGIMFCPHHPDENCDCRKPKPGLLKQIEQHSGESMFGQSFVGDSMKDIQAAQAIGAKPVLVLTGNGTKTKQQLAETDENVETYPRLLDFAKAARPLD